MKASLSNKTILITGSTDGLGKLVARHLAMQDTTVLIHGRSKSKGDSVMNELSRFTGNKKLRYYNGDYSSLNEVKELSENIIKDHDHIDILINNAGIGKGPENKRELSDEGIELRFAINYLSQVLLTEKLLPLLKESASIINVASVGQEPIDYKNLMLDTGYDGFLAYRRSKTALIMYSFDLANRLKESGIIVNALHPASLMNTNMVLQDWGHTMSTVEQGAEALENLLFIETTGGYYDGEKLSKAIPQTYDPKARANLRVATRGLLEKYITVSV
jgi:NAD(P)-dependent dehydrogenase (short-subunit alcohol dehydrogenase family)